MIDFTLPRTVDGIETSVGFYLWPAKGGDMHPVCAGGCGDWERDHVSPSNEFSFLCRPCSLLLPLLADWRKAGWPVLSSEELDRLWILARAAQISDFTAREARNSPAKAVSVGEVGGRLEAVLESAQASGRALQEAYSNQSVNRIARSV